MFLMTDSRMLNFSLISNWFCCKSFLVCFCSDYQNTFSKFLLVWLIIVALLCLNCSTCPRTDFGQLRFQFLQVSCWYNSISCISVFFILFQSFKVFIFCLRFVLGVFQLFYIHYQTICQKHFVFCF